MAKKKYVKVKCSVCKQPAFYLPKDYVMDAPILCISCGSNGNGKKKKKAVKTVTSSYANIKKGVRKDAHPTYSFRSPTEANFARILKYCKIEYKFEERVFTFDGYKNKPYVYIPDFEILSTSKSSHFEPGWYEIKGYFRSEDQSKIRRLKKHYPEEFKRYTLVIYQKSDRAAKEFCEKIGCNYLFFDELRKIFKPNIPKWEGK